MREQECQITVLPTGQQLTAVEGDNLYTLLLVAGLVEPDDARGEYFRLERGTLSPAANEEAEEAVFSKAELSEGWMLASQHQVLGDALITLYAGAVEDSALSGEQPLGHSYGMAFDLGNGTIAAGLINLDTNRIPLMTACPTSQFELVIDAQDRLAAAAEDEQLRRQLTQLLRKDMDELTVKLLRRAGIEASAITTVMVAGSYAMICLLHGHLPQPGQNFALQRNEQCLAGELGLAMIPAEARVFILPAVNSDVGGDMVAAALAAALLHRCHNPRPVMLVDLAMEGQILLAGRDRILACSVPSLPFEGAGVSCGMPAVTGAINAVQIDELVTLKTVRDGRPQGLCGAGLISAVQCLREHGLIDKEGRLLADDRLPPLVAARFRSTAAGREFVLSPRDKNFSRDISINQEDILQVQLAKGTLYAACRAMLCELGVDEQELDCIMLAESYRANLDPAAALGLGLLPRLAAEQVTPIGNAAWQGTYLALLSQRNFQEAEQLSTLIEPLDLVADQVYAEEFIKAMNF